MDILKRLFHYGRDKQGYMIFSLILSAIATVLSFVPYVFFWKLLQEITGSARLEQIQGLSLSILYATLVYSITYIASLLCSHTYAFRLETNMRKAGLKHLLRASFSFFDMHASGRTRKLIDDNASNTHTIIAHVLPDSVNALLFPICLVVLAFLASPAIGFLVVGAILFSLVCIVMMYSDQNLMKEYMEALADINSETVEYVRGIQVVKIFDMVVESFDKLYQSITRYSAVANRQCQVCKVPFVTFECVMMSFGALIIALVYKSIAPGSNGEVISLVVFFMSFSGLLYNAFMKIMFFSRYLSMGKDAIDQLENLFTEMDKNQLVHGTVTKMSNHDIVFEDVSFAYEEGLPVIEHLNLTLEAGKTYALVGSSGSGKSTLAKLISGFYPVSSGVLRIGGVPITDYSRQTLEQEIAFVFQHAKLFKTTIFENVHLAKPDSSREDVLRALELAMCNSILDKFETREETVIGAKGVHLSGGEIGRIAIARALLKDAPIVILDEASAASDPENEYEMQQAFSQLMKDKTVIMIAHRLSSIRNVDEILILKDGQVVERGNHQELMEIGPLYQHFQHLYAQANEWRM